MFVGVTFQRDHGPAHILRPGDLIGRSPRATLRLDDPRISEAHALVSLRQLDLKLIVLRGRFTVDGKARAEVVLAPGQRIVLAGVIPLTTTVVTLPDTVLAIGPADDPDAGIVVSGVVSYTAAHDHFEPGFDPDADAVFWSSDAGLSMRDRSGNERAVAPGERIDIAGHIIVARALPRHRLAAQTTDADGRFGARLRVRLHYDTVHVTGDGRVAVLDGLVARAVSELAAMRVPIHWQSLSESLWPDVRDPGTLRARWDQVLVRLRAHLREHNLRSDLIRANRRGLVELFLGPDDIIEDAT
jgi:hypothetical protein